MTLSPTRRDGPETLPKPKLLVTGASGMLAEALCPAATAEWTVYGVYHHHPVNYAGMQTLQADLSDCAGVHDLLAKVRPEAVIHTAAMSQPADCEQNQSLSEAVNVRSAIVLADWCADNQVPLVFTSTDLVFDGRHAPYAEDHPVSPICVYSRHKVQAEQAVLKRCPDALVCRLPLMFGRSAHPQRNFTMHIITAMQTGRSIPLFTDEYRTPVDTKSVANGLLMFLGKIRGVLHLGGYTRVSRYEMGLMIAQLLKTDPELARPVTIASLNLRAARSPDCSLDSRKAYGLGYAPAALSTALAQVVESIPDP